MEKPNSTLGGSQNLDVALDNQGNITTKSDAGTYTYHPTKIHAVTNIAIPGGGNMVFSYDNNGNMLNRNGTTLAWLTNNLPKSITKDANNSSTFQYGPHRQHWQHVYKTAGTTFTHTYIGKMIEKVVSGGTTEYKHFIHVNGESLALYSRKSSGTNATYYRHDDHLGSTEHLTDNAGANVVMESFGAYGKRRGTNWTGTPTPAELTTINNTTRKGFTEHEHLDSTDLVHMNGRVFDPLIGRFVSADPVMGCGNHTQNANRFAYVRNQPLIATDPTGFWPYLCWNVNIYGNDFDVALGGGFSWSVNFCIDLGGGPGFWDYFGGFGGGGPVETPPAPPAPIDWTPAGVPASTIPGPAPNPPTDPRDGCGSPDFPFPGGDGSFDMSPACAMHDRCYRRCGVSKESCDQEFASNMQQICQNSGFQILDFGFSFPNYNCSIYSATAEGIVRTIGRENYDEGQSRGC